jgi:hypothetical protein
VYLAPLPICVHSLSNIVGIKVQSGGTSFIARTMTDLRSISKMKKNDVGSSIGVDGYHSDVQFSAQKYLCYGNQPYENNISSFAIDRSLLGNSRGN